MTVKYPEGLADEPLSIAPIGLADIPLCSAPVGLADEPLGAPS